MVHDSIRINFDRQKVLRTSLVLMGSVVAVWLFPLIFREYPYFRASLDGISDILWFSAAAASPVLIFLVVRLLVYVASSQPAMMLTQTELSGYRIGRHDRKDIQRLSWSGKARGVWPGDRIVLWLAGGRTKTISVGLLRDSDAKILEEVVQHLQEKRGNTDGVEARTF